MFILVPVFILSLFREALKIAFSVLAVDGKLSYHDFVFFMLEYKPRIRESIYSNSVITSLLPVTIYSRVSSDVYIQRVEAEGGGWWQ